VLRILDQLRKRRVSKEKLAQVYAPSDSTSAATHRLKSLPAASGNYFNEAGKQYAVVGNVQLVRNILAA